MIVAEFVNDEHAAGNHKNFHGKIEKINARNAGRIALQCCVVGFARVTARVGRLRGFEFRFRPGSHRRFLFAEYKAAVSARCGLPIRGNCVHTPVRSLLESVAWRICRARLWPHSERRTGSWERKRREKRKTRTREQIRISKFLVP